MAFSFIRHYEERSHNSGLNSRASSCTIDLDTDAELEEVNDNLVADLVNHFGNNSQSQVSTDTLPLHQRNIQIGDVIEVKGTTLGDYRVDFIQVKHISRNTSSGLKFRGVPFTRTRNLMGQLPKKLNEVCMLLHFRQEDGRTPDDFPLLADVKENNVVRKRNIIMTNSMFPEHSALHGLQRQSSSRDQNSPVTRHVEQSGNLFCRWKWTIFFLADRQTLKREEEFFQRLTAGEVIQRKYRVSEDALSNRWRGGRVKGGSWKPGQESPAPFFDVNDVLNERNHLHRTRDQRYTVFDAFSGAGGVSRGAKNAGFQVTHAVDKSPEVWPTYSLNFPEVVLYKRSIDEFIQQTESSPIRIDVLHISPPCQYFSPAHTRPSARDDDNIFAQFSCSELVKKVRPRLVTIEQTFGLTFDRHQPYFRSLIGDLTLLGYSVRWKIVELWKWGLAQKRKRLIILAAGPGEQLPPFPEATHSENGENGLQPYTTIRQALRRIQDGDNLHNLTTTTRLNPRKPPYDFDTLLGTIRAGWGQFYYPDGTRNFTLREYACMQGFPRAHRFKGRTAKSIKSQIGNAFPPNCVKVLYKHLEKWLLQQDRISPHWPGINDVVMIDGELPETESFDLGRMDFTIDLTADNHTAHLAQRRSLSPDSYVMDLT